MMRYILSLIIMIIFCSMNALAVDVDSVTGISGNTIVPLNNDNVRLLKEVVNIDGTETDVKVNAKYILKNITDTKFVLIIGFPFSSSLDPYTEELVHDIKDFIVIVNDEVTAFKKRKMTEDERLKYDSEFLYEWSISFNPKEEKNIHCNYFIRWERPDFRSLSRTLSFKTKGGSQWVQSIMEADLYISLSERISKRIRKKRLSLIVMPEDYKFVNFKNIEFHYRNWEPTEDIQIEIIEN